MHMRMISFVVKGTVPFQVFNGDPHVGGNLTYLTAYHRLPSGGIVEPQSFGIFTLERSDDRPHISLMVIELF